MQGGLTLDEVYFDVKTNEVTLTDWAQLSNAKSPLVRFMPFSKAYYCGIDYGLFSASAAYLDSVAVSWLLAHVCLLYFGRESASSPAERYHQMQDQALSKIVKGQE